MVGHNVTIMPGVTIGEGATVGAKSYVTRDCEAWGIYVGIPARKIGEKSRNVLNLEQELLREEGYL